MINVLIVESSRMVQLVYSIYFSFGALLSLHLSIENHSLDFFSSFFFCYLKVINQNSKLRLFFLHFTKSRPHFSGIALFVGVIKKFSKDSLIVCNICTHERVQVFGVCMCARGRAEALLAAAGIAAVWSSTLRRSDRPLQH